MGKVVVLGGGESGCGAALLAQQKGFEVFLSDIGKIKRNTKMFLHIMRLNGKKKTL